MAWLLIIDGVDVTDQVRRSGPFELPTIDWERNTRAVMTFDIEGMPAKRARVVAYNKTGTAKVYGGLIVDRSPIEVSAGAPFCSRCECSDFLTYTDWCYWSKTYDAPVTVGAVVADLVAEKLSVYGFTVHPTQAAGLTLQPPVSWVRRKVADVLRDLYDWTGMIAKADPDMRLRLSEQGSESAPVALSESARNIGRLTWRDSSQVPANVVVGVFGPAGLGDPLTHTWTALAGVYSYSLAGVAPRASSTWPGVVSIAGATWPIWPVGMAPSGDGIEWDYTSDDGTLLFLGSAQSLISAGTAIAISYTPQFPFTVIRSTGAVPPVEAELVKETITDWPAAVLATEQALAARNQDPRIFELDTLEDGFEPNQLAAIDAPSRGAGETSGIVTRVEATLGPGDQWVYDLEVEESDTLTPDFLEGWREIGVGAGGSSAGSVTIGGVVTADQSLVVGETPVGLVDGTNASFSTAELFRAGTLAVWLNGLREWRIVETGVDSFAFETAPTLTDHVAVDYVRA